MHCCPEALKTIQAISNALGCLYEADKTPMLKITLNQGQRRIQKKPRQKLPADDWDSQ